MKISKIGWIVSVVALTLVSCNKGGVFCYSANGTIVTEERNLTAFTNIECDLSAEVTVVQSENYKVIIETSENIIGIIETKISGSTLEIDLKNGKCLKNNSTLKITVYLPELKGLDVSGSGDVYVPGKLTAETLDLEISGSGTVRMDSLDVNSLMADISGSGEIYLTGTDTVETQSIEISGSGSVEAINLPVRKSTIDMSGSGDSKVYVLETLDVEISGSGEVIYKGNPIISQQVSGSGGIRPF